MRISAPQIGSMRRKHHAVINNVFFDFIRIGIILPLAVDRNKLASAGKPLTVFFIIIDPVRVILFPFFISRLSSCPDY